MNAPQQQLQPYAVGTPFEVQDTDEFRRVLNLRRRDWEKEIQINDLHARMTQAFKIPTGTQELRLIQAAALADGHDHRGLFAPIRVGEGKTLLSFLLPVVIPGIQRPTLIVPAALVEKTWREFKVLRQHWVCHPAFMTRRNFDEAVMSYEILGRDSGRDKLNARRPDMLIGDEVHKLRNRQAACTRRVERFMIANPETIFCGMSGSITKRSLADYWHLLYWALKHGMPLPRIEAEMEKWAEALDEKKTDAIGRRAPGVLLHFCSEEERALAKPQRTAPLGRTEQMVDAYFLFQQRLTAARKGYQRRLRETPGVICSPDRNLDCSLIIRRLPVRLSMTVESHLDTLREERITPNGDLAPMPTDVWRYARELACGFYYRWEPPPPPHWATARKAWFWILRQVLDPEGIYYAKYLHLHLDSPMQVALAVTGATRTVSDPDATWRKVDEAWRQMHDGSAPPPRDHPELGMDWQIEYLRPSWGDLRVEREVYQPPTIDDPGIVQAYKNWAKVRNDYKINVVAEWLDDSTLNFCLDWMSRNGPGIVWTEHRAFGIRLAEMLGTGFCSNGGLDAGGKAIEDYNGRPVVASVAANKEGRNLQAWNRNLVVTAMPNGALWEQLIGRTHRLGQMEDTVYVDWISACEEQDQGFTQLLADARYIQDTTGQSQKLLYADRI